MTIDFNDHIFCAYRVEANRYMAVWLEACRTMNLRDHMKKISNQITVGTIETPARDDDVDDLSIHFRDDMNNPIETDAINDTDDIEYVVFQSDHGMRTWITANPHDDAYCHMCDRKDCAHVDAAVDAITALDV